MDYITQIRQFNRDYTVKLGLLDSSYLGSGLTLTQARVLQEIAITGENGASARDIALRIGTDEGYLSRILSKFVKQGWVSRQPDGADARRKVLTMTKVGQAVYAPLDAASRELTRDLTAHLSEPAQDALCAWLSQVQRLLTKPEHSDITVRGLQAGDLGWITEAHGRLYAQDEGYDLRFEALVARILADYVDVPHAQNRAFIAVDTNGQRLGCTFVVHDDDDTMRLRLVLLEPVARGRGLGKRLLAMALEHAKANNYKKMVLWTHESHQAAIALYKKAGFSLVSSEAAEAFGKQVVDQVWEKSLI
ncbi:MAG: bifunctional helix-turn-helix transcriptional regulator/GNAT family N-acetyltransferase [Cognatishimia sp.]